MPLRIGHFSLVASVHRFGSEWFRVPARAFKISAFLLVLDNLATEVYRFPGVFGGAAPLPGQVRVIYYCRSAS